MEIIKIQGKFDGTHLMKTLLPEHARMGGNDKPALRPADIMQHSGKVLSWPESPVEYQQQLRREWD